MTSERKMTPDQIIAEWKEAYAADYWRKLAAGKVEL